MFQNTPSILTAALIKIRGIIATEEGAALYGGGRWTREFDTFGTLRFGAIVSVQSGELRERKSWNSYQFAAIEDAQQCCAAVKFANPRATVELDPDGFVSMSLDPIPQFAFHHIEWF